MRRADVIPIASHPGRAGVVSRCRATTISGRPCRNRAVGTSDYCRVHGGRGSAAAPPPDTQERGRSRLEEACAGVAEFVRTRLSGDYTVDDFGFDEHLFRAALIKFSTPLYQTYFRVRTVGINRIPDEGAALLVANHSGTIPLDAVMMQHAVAVEHPQRRVVRNVGANLVWRTPFISALARKSGTAVACDEDAYQLLERGELVGIFPEGFKGVGKGWKERYRLQRFGRGGFIELALRARVPIIPVAIVGAEETYPMIADIKPLARILGLPYFPVTPTFPLLGPLGALPLPSKWVIEFGAPVPMDDYPEEAADDAMLVFDLTDRIRDRIQQMLVRGLDARAGTFL